MNRNNRNYLTYFLNYLIGFQHVICHLQKFYIPKSEFVNENLEDLKTELKLCRKLQIQQQEERPSLPEVETNLC